MTYYAGAVLYNPATESVFLHLRDGNTAYNPNKWGIFGGTNDPADGEDPKKTVIRELKEELGHTFSTDELIPLRQNVGETTGIMRYIFYIICDLPKSAFTLGEGADMEWHKLDTIEKLPLTPQTIVDLVDTLRSLVIPNTVQGRL